MNFFRGVSFLIHNCIIYLFFFSQLHECILAFSIFSCNFEIGFRLKFYHVVFFLQRRIFCVVHELQECVFEILVYFSMKLLFYEFFFIIKLYGSEIHDHVFRFFAFFKFFDNNLLLFFLNVENIFKFPNCLLNFFLAGIGNLIFHT